MSTGALPGVRVGPLDPDATREFGQVAQQNSARQLIRLHRRMYPPNLQRALARPLQEGHSKAVYEHLTEAVADYVSGLTHQNGDPVIPEGAEIVGANVRGDKATGMVLTFQFRLPSGRIGKWYAPYVAEKLPDVFEVGQHYTRVHQMREQGLVAFDQEAAGQELYRRQLQRSQQENARLRAIVEGRSSESADEVAQTGSDVPADSAQLDELDRLRREVEEFRRDKAQREALAAAHGGGMPTAGLEADIAASTGTRAPQAGSGESVAAQEPPFDGYEDLKADEVCKRLRDPETSADERRAILEYERTHANRRSVVAAGEQSLQ